MPKKRKFESKITVFIPKELLEWLEDGVRTGKFANISHGVRQCIAIAKTYTEVKSGGEKEAKP
jgi:Arc/MetJ-type ribon-helix-helix transcriptional regulator